MSKQLTVFIVDDNDAAAKSLAALVASMGLQFVVYPSAEEFLAQYDGRSGCLLLDVRLPGISGIDLQQQLARDQIHLPVILMSGHADSDVADRAIENGAIGLLEKPFLLTDLQAAIDTAFSRLESE